MKELHQPRIWYKGVILQQIIDVLINDCKATSEEQAAVKKLIEASRNLNQHIVILFDNTKTHITTLAEMKNVIPYIS